MSQPTALRDALRVKPGSRVRLEKVDHQSHVRARQGDVGRGHREADGAPARAAGPAVGRVEAFGPGRPAGDRRGRQGRHDRQGHGGVQPAGLPGHLVQGADRRGARPRLPVADPQADAGQGRGRHLQPVALRGRARRPGPRTSCRRASGRSATTRSTTSNGRSPRAARPSSSSSCRSTRTSSASGSSRATTTRRSAGSSRSATSRSASTGTTTRRAFDDMLSKTSTDWAPWYVIPANRNWFRNLAVSTILADTMADLKPAYPTPPDLPPEPRHRVGAASPPPRSLDATARSRRRCSGPARRRAGRCHRSSRWSR